MMLDRMEGNAELKTSVQQMLADRKSTRLNSSHNA